MNNKVMNNVAPNPLQWYISTLYCWVTGRSLASRYVLTTVIIVSAILVAHELPFDLGRAALNGVLIMHATFLTQSLKESVYTYPENPHTDACCRTYGCTYSVSRYIRPYIFFPCELTIISRWK